MASTISKCLTLFLMSLMFVTAKDSVDRNLKSSGVIKILRAMVNQTNADTLNLPANASSIRENITDTFSCENRTYGYYADVDNDCQLFHVCLPSQTPSGRNVTYRWSFICPAETVFNQEVLVCTRSIDSIDCEESPNYYDLNMEIGKERNDTQKEESVQEATARPTKKVRVPSRKTPEKRKQNIIVESLIQEVVKDELEGVEVPYAVKEEEYDMIEELNEPVFEIIKPDAERIDVIDGIVHNTDINNNIVKENVQSVDQVQEITKGADKNEIDIDQDKHVVIMNTEEKKQASNKDTSKMHTIATNNMEFNNDTPKMPIIINILKNSAEKVMKEVTNQSGDKEIVTKVEKKEIKLENNNKRPEEQSIKDKKKVVIKENTLNMKTDKENKIAEEIKPIMNEQKEIPSDIEFQEEENSRLFSERSFRWRGKKNHRGSHKFKSNN